MTDLLIHPIQNDVVVTASADGTAKYFNSSNYSAASIHGRNSNGERGHDASAMSESDFVTLLQEPAAVSSVDFHAGSNALLATTAIGGMWTMQL